MTKIGVVRVLLCALVVGGLTACRNGDGESGEAREAAHTSTTEPARRVDAVFGRIPAVVRDVEPSVVAVLTNLGEGSGVVWRREGLVLTNHHVVDGARSVELAFADGKRAPAEVVASDPLTDLALVRTGRHDLPAATFATDLPVVGELAIAIGNPLGFENTVTAGIISGLQRSIPGSAPRTQALIDLIQTDAAISPGNSGGALVDGDGKVVGINVAYIPPQARAVSIGFAIPAPTVSDVARQLLESGTVRHSFFGIQPGPLTPQVAGLLDVEVDAGVLVLDVVRGAPAEAAGIRPGDVIVATGADEVRSVEGFLAQLRGRDPGDRLEVDVVRDGQRLTLSVVLGERPAGPTASPGG
ncbi:MAG: S1C family serine protease [Acidimicrobiia bacterium]